MAKQTFSITATSATDSDFRLWGSTLSGALSALLTKVTQSGEINWSTVLKPASSSASQGFEVFRFNDALHATYPVYIKFEYGSGSSATVPSLWMTIGKTIDGSGTVGAVLQSRVQVLQSGNATATPYSSYASSLDGSALALAWIPAAVNYCTDLLIERSRDSSGNPTGAGLLIQYRTIGQNAVTCKAISYSNLTANILAKGMFFIPFNLSTDVSIAFGTNNPFFTGTVINPDGVSWIPRCAIGVAKSNLGTGQVVTAMYSGNDYLGIGAGAQQCDAAGQTYASMAICWI